MLWRLRPAETDILLNTYTRELLIELEKQQDTKGSAWRENGGLYIADNPERLAEYERLSEMGNCFGIESRLLAPIEINDIHPLINVADVHGGLYSPTDGTIDPTGAVTAYAKAAKGIGAKIFENTGVASIDTEDFCNIASGASRTRITAVRTECGHVIQTPNVINASGCWSQAVADMVDATLPLRAVKHAFVVTDSLPGMHSELPNVRDHDLSVYLKTQGDAMCIGGYERNPEFWGDLGNEFSFGLFDLDWETFDQNITGALHRCKAIETAGITSTVCGPESFTPDHKPLVGPQPGVRGMWSACGANSMGMMLGGGIGRELAEWVATGSPNIDMFAMDPSRFHGSTVDDDKWVLDRTHESYKNTYDIVFPHDESLAGRGARKSVLHDELLSRGCMYQARHGFERPGWFVRNEASEPDDASIRTKEYDYGGGYADDVDGAWRLGKPDCEVVQPHTEHRYHSLVDGELTFGWPKSHQAVAVECAAARTGVAIFDQSYFGKFILQGPKATEAVRWLCAADPSAKPVGTVTYTPLCNDKGGVEADLTVSRLDENRYYFAAGGNTATKDWEWILKVLHERGFTGSKSGGGGLELLDKSDDYTLISVQGPHSKELLRKALGSELYSKWRDLPFSHCTRLPLRKAVDGAIVDSEMLLLRLTFVGELGYELHVPSDSAAKLYRQIVEVGKVYAEEHSVLVRETGYRAIDSLSAEMNYRHWHADLSNRETPMEAGIGFTVLPRLKRIQEASLTADAIEMEASAGAGAIASSTASTADSFLGSDALQQHRSTGLQRKLVCLVVDNANVPMHGMETIWRGGECVGFVRSTAFGHTLKKTIVYGYVGCPADMKKVTNKWLKGAEWSVGAQCKGRHAAQLHLKAPHSAALEGRGVECMEHMDTRPPDTSSIIESEPQQEYQHPPQQQHQHQQHQHQRLYSSSSSSAARDRGGWHSPRSSEE
jgi:sarcosine dehydrogenase